MKLIEEAFYTLKFHQTKGFFSFFGEIYPFWRWNWRQNINLVKTWWKPGEISKVGQKKLKFPKPGENLAKFPKPGENLVKFRKLVKKSDISKTWWKPGEI